MKLVVIESPYAGDPGEIDVNVDYARACIKDSLKRGEAPIASHLLYTQPGILDDNIPGERRLGIYAGQSWIRASDMVAVYTDLGISSGMEEAIRTARRTGIEIEYRSLMEWKQ